MLYNSGSQFQSFQFGRYNHVRITKDPSTYKNPILLLIDQERWPLKMPSTKFGTNHTRLDNVQKRQSRITISHINFSLRWLFSMFSPYRDNSRCRIRYYSNLGILDSSCWQQSQVARSFSSVFSVFGFDSTIIRYYASKSVVSYLTIISISSMIICRLFHIPWWWFRGKFKWFSSYFDGFSGMPLVKQCVQLSEV